jgi:Ca-activated chloride channel family protein
MNKLRTATVLLLVGLVGTVGCSIGTKDDGDADVEADSRQDQATTTSVTGADDEDSGSTEAPDDSGSTEAPDGALLLIMDASGSMNGEDAGGEPLIDSAKAALHQVVDSLPDGLPAGLRVFGHRYPEPDKTNGCRDSELISPVEPLDRDALDRAIDNYDAKGYTPIGYSLQEAAKDLPPEGKRTIILVSDGDDTCAPPDPCEIAENLRADGVDVVIDTVGVTLGTDDAARDQLGCIADKGGGQFYDVTDAADLAATLTDLSTREARRFEPEGTVLEGAPTPSTADTGQIDIPYTDTILGGETNYYRFEIEPGSTVRAEVTLVGDPGNDADRLLCPEVYLTDDSDQSYANAPFPGDDATATQIKNTDPVEVDTEEVWIKIAASNCMGPGADPGLSFAVQLQVATAG